MRLKSHFKKTFIDERSKIYNETVRFIFVHVISCYLILADIYSYGTKPMQ